MSAERRVLVLATTFPAEVGDDTASFVLDLSQEIADRFDTTVLVPRTRRAPIEEKLGRVKVARYRYFPSRWETVADGAILLNVRHRPWKILQLPPLILGMLLRALRDAYAGRVDVIHAHWIVPAGLIALIVKRITGVPYIVTVHGADAFSLRGWLYERVRDRVTGAADAVVPVSTEIAKAIGLPDAVVVPMGVKLDIIAPIEPTTGPQAWRFAAVGRLAPKKGFDVAVRAIAGLPQATLVIIGDGPERAYLEGLVEKLQLQDRVFLSGPLPRRDVISEMSKAQALIIPSLEAPDGDRDGTPVVLAEAIANNVPVVASRIGGMAELLDDDSAVLVPAGDIFALRNALAITPQSELRRRAAIARERVGPLLDVTAAGVKYLALLERALAR